MLVDYETGTPRSRFAEPTIGARIELTVWVGMGVRTGVIKLRIASLDDAGDVARVLGSSYPPLLGGVDKFPGRSDGEARLAERCDGRFGFFLRRWPAVVRDKSYGFRDRC